MGAVVAAVVGAPVGAAVGEAGVGLHAPSKSVTTHAAVRHAERFNWHFVPLERKGPTFRDFNEKQKLITEKQKDKKAQYLSTVWCCVVRKDGVKK